MPLKISDLQVSIDSKFLCDSVINCDDASDESNCDDDRFYCENGEMPVFVRKSQVSIRLFEEKIQFLLLFMLKIIFFQVKDGKADCTDWSDECPSINGSTLQNAFSSRYEMIDNPALRVFVWLMGVLAAAGNIVGFSQFYVTFRFE